MTVDTPGGGKVATPHPLSCHQENDIPVYPLFLPTHNGNPYLPEKCSGLILAFNRVGGLESGNRNGTGWDLVSLIAP